MNHVLTTVHTSNPSTVHVTITPTSASTPTPTSAVQASLLHRIELRVALWLLMRSARRQEPELDHAEQHRRRRNSSERARREQDALRAWCAQCMHH
ncbi:hypothetical protein [Pseudoclavibacter sp. 8L]|uniref:hypothetical protein n=1 Tax=Pseudoclavibacter sp. 8L TaxID=2653162 RepID=UPI0012EF898E|nr:hypothetical protein [Pseudoclavibacter sp. 8L]VXC25412.1 conserved exported hypothetical protein [Pseudoclavibacter sp. 8L]